MQEEVQEDENRRKRSRELNRDKEWKLRMTEKLVEKKWRDVTTGQHDRI